MIQEFQKLLVPLVFLALAAGPAFAKKPDSPGNSGKNAAEHSHKHDSSSAGGAAPYQDYFDERRRNLVRNYYGESRNAGSCPPGLAKKNNGCQPPGQAKKWRKGHPLPSDVIYYDVPTALLHELGRTPEGQKIVRVGTDLLLISIGTGMVIDALEGLDDVF